MDDDEELGKLLAEYGIRHSDRPHDDGLLWRLDDEEEAFERPQGHDDDDEEW